MPRIAVAGHLCVDVTPRMSAGTRLEPGRLFEVGPLGIALGGCVANTGGDLADLGADVRVSALVGDDDLGALATSLVAARGALGTPETVPGATTSYSVVLETPGTDRTFWHHTGANDRFDGSTVDLDGIDLLHVGYPPLLPGLLPDHGAPLRALLERARAAGATTSLDLAVVDPEGVAGSYDWEPILRSALRATDVLSPSLDDLTSALRLPATDDSELVPRLADQLIEWGAAVVLLSAGAGGLILRTAGADRLAAGGTVLAALGPEWADRSIRTAPAPVARPLTTNGAGDAASAGFLHGLALGLAPEDACALATGCSGAIIEGRRTTREAVVAHHPHLDAVLPGGRGEP